MPDSPETAPMSFDRYAPKYDRMATLNPAYQENIKSFRDFLSYAHLPEQSRVCDIGAGTGNYILAMSEIAPGSSFTHIDCDSKMNSIAQSKYENAGLQNVEIVEDYFQRVEIAAESYDLVVCVNALFAIQPYQVVLKKIEHILKPGGAFFLIDFGRKQDVVDWGWYLFESIAKRFGYLKASREVLKFMNVTRENMNTTKGQESGAYWLHSTDEFMQALESSGLTVQKAEPCYRGYADLAYGVKPAAICVDFVEEAESEGAIEAALESRK